MLCKASQFKQSSSLPPCTGWQTCQPSAQTAHHDCVCPSSMSALLTAMTHLSTHHKGSTLKDKSVTPLQRRLQNFAIDLCLNAEGKIMGHVLKLLMIYLCWHRCKDKLHWCFSCYTILIPGRISASCHSFTFLVTTCQRTSKGSCTPRTFP